MITGKKTIATAPAKLILSGEHAVVYGQPALAMALDLVTTTTIVSQKSHDIIFSLPDLNYQNSVTLLDLQRIAEAVQPFQHPTELAKYAFAKLIEHFNFNLPNGFTITINSDIPISSGLGSSAALIVSIIHAVNNFFSLEIPLPDYFTLGREIENIQHGKSSGIDIFLATHGGAIKFINGKIEQRDFTNFQFLLVNTGKAASSTAESVAAAAKYFAQSKTLASDFGAVTNDLDDALQNNKFPKIKECIRNNHTLLTKIGVVPEKVQQFLCEAEKRNGVGKICGAGSMSGENAGIVMIFAENDIIDLINRFGYQLLTIGATKHGVRII
jgi:mevalonate kinase